jgi:polar amino acid transport system substrate-binding protein
MLRLLLILIAGLVLSGGALAEQTLRLMANTSPPYSDDKLPERGLALELVEHIFSRTDYKPDIAIDSWSRALEGASIGVYDALAAAWYSDERNEAFLFSEPYLDSKLIILKARSTPGRYTQLKDLAGARLGVRTDYAYGIDFSQVPELQLVEENHLIQNLLNLLNGKVQFVIGDRRTVVFQLNEYLKDQIHKFEVLEIDLPGRARHVAASRQAAGHEDVINAFNKALAEVRKDGSYAAIIRKWDERYPGLK